MDMVYPFVAFFQGILTFLSPCMLPMVALFVSYMIASQNKKLNLIYSLLIVSGFTTVFLIFGSLASFVGSFLQTYHIIFSVVSGFLLIILGLFMLIKCSKHHHCHHEHDKAIKPGYVKSYFMGIMIALSGEPCIVAYVGSAVISASNMSNPFAGVIILSMYSLGLGILFIVGAFFSDKLMNLWNRLHKYEKLTKVLSAIFIIGIGLVFATDPLWHNHSDDFETISKNSQELHKHDDGHEHNHEH